MEILQPSSIWQYPTEVFDKPSNSKSLDWTRNERSRRKYRLQMWSTYDADLYAVVIGEVEAFPIRGAHKVVRGIYYWVLDRLQMSERLSADRSFEYLYDRVCADLLSGTLDRPPMVDCVDVKLC